MADEKDTTVVEETKEETKGEAAPAVESTTPDSDTSGPWSRASASPDRYQ